MAKFEEGEDPRRRILIQALTLGLFGNALFEKTLGNLRFRIAMTRVAAALMAVMGVSFILRGAPAFL